MQAPPEVDSTSGRTRVLFIIPGLRLTGGSERALCRLLSQIDGKKFDCGVICLADGGSVAEELTQLGVYVREMRMRKLAPSPLGFLELAREVRKFRPDIIQSWLYSADLAALLAKGVYRSARLSWNVRRSATLSGQPRRRRLLLWLLRLFSNIPDVVVFNSVAGEASHFEYGYRPKRSIVIPNGIDTEKFCPSEDAVTQREKLGLPNDKILIASVARFSPEKDHLNFLAAAALLRKRVESVHFVMVGRGMDRSNTELQRIIDRFQIASRISLLGERADVAALLSCIDLFTLHSSSEGFPNVLIEAMACGCRCVSTDVGDARKILQQSESIVESGNSKKLAQAWEYELEKSQELIHQEVRRNQLVVKTRYSLEAMVAQYEALFEGLMQS